VKGCKHGCPELKKIINIEEATALIPDGSTIALGGLSMNSTPMAMVRELVRQGKKDLTVVAIVNGMAVDWLIAGGCVRRVWRRISAAPWKPAPVSSKNIPNTY